MFHFLVEAYDTYIFEPNGCPSLRELNVCLLEGLILLPSLFSATNRKNRSFRSTPLVTRGMKNLQSVKTLASHTASMGISNKHYNPRKQPISVSQQFQQSLHSLMVTLNQANPFFIRCIKSNSDKVNFICTISPLYSLQRNTWNRGK